MESTLHPNELPGISHRLAESDAPSGVPGRLEQVIMRHARQSSAYFTVQAGLTHHYLHDGAFCYAPVQTPFGRINLSCTDPLVSPALLPHTLADIRRLKGVPVLLGVTHEVARAASEQGWIVNHMGMEHSIELEHFELSGRDKKQLRHAANLNRRLPVTVVEHTHVPHIPESVQALSEAWRQSKTIQARELRLLTRPPVFKAEWGVRKFYCHHADGRLLGFVFFDPWFENGRITGYCANILRSDPALCRHPILDYTLLQALKRFRQEGIRRVSLGIAPLDQLQPHPQQSGMLYRLGQFMYRYGNGLYAFQALAYHKSRYRGHTEPWFLCTPSKNALKVTWSILQGTGILPS
ncbi:MAG: DUF2156 domain-containing protein [Gammaproteobacteria bacterium]|nr:MAG: DUF2156 domain-containing protein [Gammaproteobacteria bacterium]